MYTYINITLILWVFERIGITCSYLGGSGQSAASRGSIFQGCGEPKILRFFRNFIPTSIGIQPIILLDTLLSSTHIPAIIIGLPMSHTALSHSPMIEFPSPSPIDDTMKKKNAHTYIYEPAMSVP